MIRICKINWYYVGTWRSTFYIGEPEARARMRETVPEPGMADTLEFIEVEPTVGGIVAALNKYADDSRNGLAKRRLHSRVNFQDFFFAAVFTPSPDAGRARRTVECGMYQVPSASRQAMPG